MSEEIPFYLPKRHEKRATFDNFETDNENLTLAKKVLQELDSESDHGLYIHGDSGTGKTHLLVAAAKKLTEEGARVGYVNAGQLWACIGDVANKYVSDNLLVQADVVFVDDIDISSSVTRESTFFSGFIMDLYDQAKPLVMSSNHDIDSLTGLLIESQGSQVIGQSYDQRIHTKTGKDATMIARVSDRLSEMCLVVSTEGVSSYRASVQNTLRDRYR